MWGDLFNIETIILHTAIAIIIVMILSKVHEYIHIYEAKKFGIKINNINWWKNEIDIEITKEHPHWKQVAYTPYYYLIPVGVIIAMIGIYFQYFGIVIGGAGTILINVISIKGEGSDEECKKDVVVEAKQTILSSEIKEK